MHCDAKEVELSRTLSSSSREIKNLATTLLLRVMKSHCIPVDLPSHEKLSNLYLKGASPLRRKLSPIFRRYVNSTHVLYFFCIFQVVLIFLAAHLGFI